MKKRVVIQLIFFFLIALVSAAGLEIQKIDKGSVVISELNNPAVFDFIIQNKNASDVFEIYSLVGVSISPREKFALAANEKKTIEIMAWPNEDLRKESGFLNFEYEIQGEQAGILKDKLMIKIVPLSQALEISVKPILPYDENVTILVKNKENTHLQNLKIKFDSVFFLGEEYISFLPNQEVQVQIPINKNVDKLLAGPYIMKSEVELQKKNVEFESIIDYLEKEGISVDEKTEGFILRETTIKKINKGNTPVTAEISVKKDAISRLFTLNSPSPDSVERKGFSVVYIWQKDISPTESLEIKTTTNYTVPFIIIILIVIIGILTRIYSQTALTLNKKVSFVRTKSGDLALKVNIRVKARRHVDKIQLVDSLPGMTKLYEKFGRLPDKVDNTSRRLFWNLPYLNAGEERVFSYIIYSRLKIVGRLELPAATAVFEHEGKTKEAWSNRTFFITGSSS